MASSTVLRGSDFSELTRRITAAGLLGRRPGYYALRIGIVAGLYLGGWAAFAFLGSSWWQLLVGVLLAVAFAQVMLLAHDLAHQQIARSRRRSGIAGRIAGNLGVGMSYGWWRDKHTRHHANPNHEELDPDVAPDLLIWTEDQARDARGVTSLVGGRQAYLFFPLLTLEALNLRMASIRAMRQRRDMPGRRIEIGLFCAHIAGYLAALLLVLTPLQALAFLAVHQGLLGIYLGSTFAPNHKGMPTVPAGQKLDFLRKQVLTSRNICGGVLVDTAYGGLNHQIEHHLYPSMPTPNLRRARPIVRDYCNELGLPYTEAGVIGSYAQALGHLNELSTLHRQYRRQR